MFESHAPFLLDFLEPVNPMSAPEEHYNPATQCGSPAGMAATQRSQSFQNRTSGYSVLTAYEDADDEYVTRSD